MCKEKKMSCCPDSNLLTAPAVPSVPVNTHTHHPADRDEREWMLVKKASQWIIQSRSGYIRTMKKRSRSWWTRCPCDLMPQRLKIVESAGFAIVQIKTPLLATTHGAATEKAVFAKLTCTNALVC